MTNFKTFWESLKKIFLPLTEQTGSATLAHGIRRGRHTERPGSGRRECEKKPPRLRHERIFCLYLTSNQAKAPLGFGASVCRVSHFGDCHDGCTCQGCPQGQKNFPDTHYRPENFFALTCASGMAQNTDGISPLWETGRGGWGNGNGTRIIAKASGTENPGTRSLTARIIR